MSDQEQCQGPDVTVVQRLSVLETEIEHLKDDMSRKPDRETGIDPHIAKLYTQVRVLEESHKTTTMLVRVLLGGLVSLAIWLLKMQLFGVGN